MRAQPALVDGRPAGHVAFFPARRRELDDRRHCSGLAHLWQLSVLPSWSGRGVASVLHDAAVAELRGLSYERARLCTPSPTLGPAASTSAGDGRRTTSCGRAPARPDRVPAAAADPEIGISLARIRSLGTIPHLDERTGVALHGVARWYRHARDVRRHLIALARITVADVPPHPVRIRPHHKQIAT
jgi:GNAT superfamily N-acetyltransferase